MRIDNPAERHFYEIESVAQNWSVRQLRLTNLPDFPLMEFLGISFTHHIHILAWRMYAA